MSDFKNIDRIFQENLKNFEAQPSYKSWNIIEKQLAVRPVKKRFSFLFKIASVAALLLLIFSLTTLYILPVENFSEKISSKKIEKLITNKADITISTKQKIIKTTSKPVAKFLEKDTELATENITLLKSSADKKETNSATSSVSSLKNQLSLFNAEAPITDKFSENKLKENKVNTNELEKSKFTVSTIFAPIYFASSKSGSSINAEFKNNSTSGNVSFSYGVKVAYELNEKFTLQSGINLINLGYTTNNVYANSGQSSIRFSDLYNSPIIAKTTEKSQSYLLNEGSLNQVIGYIEIPVELKYNVKEGKLGINLVGGFSTLVLNKDEVYFQSNSFSQNLGSSNNLRSMNFSGNVGLDLDYLLHRNFYFNISPMLKVQTNTFSKNFGNIQPYYLGVYTGLNYKF